MASSPTSDDVVRRRAGLGAWRRDSLNAVGDLAAMFGATDPLEAASRPLDLIPSLLTTFASADLAAWDADQRAWWWSHLVAHVAAVVVDRHGGDWSVDDRPGSGTYGRYVLSGFDARPEAIVDVGELVHQFLASPAPRSFLALLAAAEEAV